MNTPNSLSAGGTFNGYPPAPVPTLYRVECVNGAQEIFSTMQAAAEYAEWGHCCGAVHQFAKLPPGVDEWLRIS